MPEDAEEFLAQLGDLEAKMDSMLHGMGCMEGGKSAKEAKGRWS